MNVQRLSRARRIGLWAAILAVFFSSSTLAYIRQEATPVTLDSALAEFRRTQESADGSGPGDVVGADTTPAAPAGVAPPDGAAPGSAPGGGPAPPPGGAAPAGQTGLARSPAGVYTNATSGYEYTDAVGGSRHDYPPESSLTLRHTECGLTTRWQPLNERWDEATFCTVGDALEMRVFSMYHEFFQTGQQLDYICAPGSRVFDRSEPAGANWMWRCETEGGAVETKNTVVGVESLTIGGRTLQVVHMHYQSALTGSSEGTQVQERWIDLESGLVVRLKSDVTARTESPFGRVGYEEHYLIEMTSTTPRT